MVSTTRKRHCCRAWDCNVTIFWIKWRPNSLGKWHENMVKADRSIVQYSMSSGWRVTWHGRSQRVSELSTSSMDCSGCSVDYVLSLSRHSQHCRVQVCTKAKQVLYVDSYVCSEGSTRGCTNAWLPPYSTLHAPMQDRCSATTRYRKRQRAALSSIVQTSVYPVVNKDILSLLILIA